MQSVHIRMNSSLSPSLKKILDPPMEVQHISPAKMMTRHDSRQRRQHPKNQQPIRTLEVSVVKGEGQGLELYGVWSRIGDRVDQVARGFSQPPFPRPIFSILFLFLIFFIFLRYDNFFIFTLIFSIFNFIF